MSKILNTNKFPIQPLSQNQLFQSPDQNTLSRRLLTIVDIIFGHLDMTRYTSQVRRLKIISDNQQFTFISIF